MPLPKPAHSPMPPSRLAPQDLQPLLTNDVHASMPMSDVHPSKSMSDVHPSKSMSDVHTSKITHQPVALASSSSSSKKKPSPFMAPKSSPVEHVEPPYFDDPLAKWGHEPVKIDPLFMYNKELSDALPEDRALPEIRPNGCKARVAAMDLSIMPQTSVVIVSHNEAHSTLRRTVASVLNRSPPQLLKEIIVVDDNSDWDQEGPIKHMDKVTVVRSEKRVGLMLARLRGFAKASAPTVTFLDSHVECQPGWLPPLLEQMAMNTSTVVSPVIDIITEDTMKYVPVNRGMRGIFDWQLTFKWKTDPNSQVAEHMPFESPAHAGGLFTISKAYFVSIGLYDTGMHVWGYENIELSLRVWMCHGRLTIDPCSRVGHIFRSKSPLKPTGENYQLRNKLRTAAVWLDDYAPQVMGPSHSNTYGDVSDRVALRKRLKCHNFKWYLDTVFPDHPVLMHATTLGNRGHCLDTMGKVSSGTEIGLYACHEVEGNQRFDIDTSDPGISKITVQSPTEDTTLCARPGESGSGLVLGDCEDWKAGWLTHGNGDLYHQSTSKCLLLNEQSTKVMMGSCKAEGSSWQWQCRGSPIKANMQGLKETSTSLCVDTMGHGPGETAGVWSCHGAGGNQAFRFRPTKTGQDEAGILTNNEQGLCLQAPSKQEPAKVLLEQCAVCNGQEGAKDASCVWKRSGGEVHPYESSHCLTIAEKHDGGHLETRPCREKGDDALSWDTSEPTYGLCRSDGE